MGELAYNVKDVHYSYCVGNQQTAVLKDINIEIKTGEFVAIVGPSGSGKSTLMHLLSGMTRTQTGSIMLQGTALDSCTEEELAHVRNNKIGFVFQQFFLLPSLSVLDNILLPTQYPLDTMVDHEHYRARAIELAETLGLSHRLKHRPNELSGGEQQRVVVARALLKGANIILADEPTGNLDSRNSGQIMEVLQQLNDQGKTIILVTHDQDVAACAKRTIEIKDGEVRHDTGNGLKASATLTEEVAADETKSPLTTLANLITLAWQNLSRKKSQSLLTASGITIGVAAIIIMMTLGQFAKERILSSYNKLGATTVAFSGYPNWRLTASDQISSLFLGFSPESDLEPLTTLIPQVKRISPIIRGSVTVSYAGQVYPQDIDLFGVNQDYFPITQTRPARGHIISNFDVTQHSPVCVIGQDIYQRLFSEQKAISKIITLKNNSATASCTVISVLPYMSDGESANSDLNARILIPYTFFNQIASPWQRFITRFFAQVDSISDVIPVGKAIENYFNHKYGISGIFQLDHNTRLLSNIREFLNIFTMLLAAISLVSLIVAGIGITNMMLASISERLSEIGLRKALGSTDGDMYQLFLVESVLLCTLSGLAGLVIGFFGYEGIIYLTSQFVPSIQFKWTFSPLAISLALGSMVVVGVLSGIAPAKRARDLDVIACLRG